MTEVTIPDAWALLKGTEPLCGADKVRVAQALATAEADLAALRGALRDLLDGRKGAREQARTLLGDQRIANVDAHVAALTEGSRHD